MTPQFELPKGYKESTYAPDPLVIEDLNGSIAGMRLVLVSGSWCPDCQVLVPKLKVVLDALEPNFSFEFIEMVRGKPLKVAMKMNIQAIPTIIVFDGAKEMGRIIERVSDSVERDLVKILGRGK